MKGLRFTAVVAIVVGSTLGLTSPASAGGNQAFGFNAPLISGFPGGREVRLTGGGAFRLSDFFVHSAGGFRCLSDIAAGPLTGCLTGEGVRWDTVDLLTSTGFQCTGSDPAGNKTAFTGDKTVALLADFYRQGDGDVESFTARMFVSESDLAPDIAGVQNVWIAGVGCGTAIVNFNKQD